jgi:hypothetical protein
MERNYIQQAPNMCSVKVIILVWDKSRVCHFDSRKGLRKRQGPTNLISQNMN